MPMGGDDFLKIHIHFTNSMSTMKLINVKINQIPIKVSKVNQSPQKLLHLHQ
jgi:hypothetical protein